MTLTLRPDQERFVSGLRTAFTRGSKRVLGVAPTGMGKTVCATYMVRGSVDRGHRVLFAAGRRELIEQTVATLARAGLDDVRVIQGRRDEGRADAPVIVGSIDTLAKPRMAGKVAAVQFGILDECHHATSFTWRSVLDSHPSARWVGLTATPERADGAPLGDIFNSLVVGPSVAELTAAGHLVPCRGWAGPPDLKPGQLALTPLEAYHRFAAGQRAAVFCRDREHARAELEVFRTAGVLSDIVTGDMPAGRRKAVLDAWRDGSIHVVTSVGVLTEGFDLPALGVAILARRFGHAGQFLQAVGRILRPSPGKTEALLVDLAGSVHEHGMPELEREYSLDGKAIRRSNRDAIRQCRDCGAVFLAGPRQCPTCGVELPVRTAPPPRSTGVGVTEVTAAARKPWWSRLAAKREGYCGKCARWFPKGTAIIWAKGYRARHQKCPLPALPSAAMEVA